MKAAKCGASNPPAGKSAKINLNRGGMVTKKKPTYSKGGLAKK